MTGQEKDIYMALLDVHGRSDERPPANSFILLIFFFFAASLTFDRFGGYSILRRVF